MSYEGQTVIGSFTVSAPATKDQVVAYAIEFCRDNDTRFLGVI